MENKKTVFWFVGTACSGKSYFAEKLSANLNIPFLHLDCVNDYKTQSKEMAYKSLFNRIDPNQLVYIIDGIIPFSFNRDKLIVDEILKDTRIIFVLATPYYNQYQENVKKRILEKSDTIELSKEDYSKSLDIWDAKIGRPYIIIRNEADLNKITEEDLRSINYQHIGFTNKKWEQLKVDCQGKSVLDLGCSSCYYQKFAEAEGATKYTGLDVNMAYLFNKDAHLFDLNKLDDWYEKSDIVISTSVYHYIGDKEKFIKEASRLTNDTFIFETPLSKLDGKLIQLEPNRHLLFTTKDLTEFWIKKYFKSFECLGQSIVEDNSYRLIYHCKK